jgi:hypothetical protein
VGVHLADWPGVGNGPRAGGKTGLGRAGHTFVPAMAASGGADHGRGRPGWRRPVDIRSPPRHPAPKPRPSLFRGVAPAFALLRNRAWRR